MDGEKKKLVYASSFMGKAVLPSSPCGKMTTSLKRHYEWLRRRYYYKQSHGQNG